MREIKFVEKLTDWMGCTVLLVYGNVSYQLSASTALRQILVNPRKEYKLYTPAGVRHLLRINSEVHTLKGIIQSFSEEWLEKYFKGADRDIFRQKMDSLREDFGTAVQSLYPGDASEGRMSLGLKEPVLCTWQNIQECIEKAKSEDSWVFTDFASRPLETWEPLDVPKSFYGFVLKNKHSEEIMLLSDTLLEDPETTWVLYKEETDNEY